MQKHWDHSQDTIENVKRLFPGTRVAVAKGHHEDLPHQFEDDEEPRSPIATTAAAPDTASDLGASKHTVKKRSHDEEL